MKHKREFEHYFYMKKTNHKHTRITELEQVCINLAKLGQPYTVEFSEMMGETDRYFNEVYYNKFHYKTHPEINEEGEKIYKTLHFPMREVFKGVNILDIFYVIPYNNYNCRMIQSIIIQAFHAYNRKHKVNISVTTHRNNNEVKVTRVG